MFNTLEMNEDASKLRQLTRNMTLLLRTQIDNSRNNRGGRERIANPPPSSCLNENKIRVHHITRFNLTPPLSTSTDDVLKMSKRSNFDVDLIIEKLLEVSFFLASPWRRTQAPHRLHHRLLRAVPHATRTDASMRAVSSLRRFPYL
jgi:hypothetical protein